MSPGSRSSPNRQADAAGKPEGDRRLVARRRRRSRILRRRQAVLVDTGNYQVSDAADADDRCARPGKHPVINIRKSTLRFACNSATLFGMLSELEAPSQADASAASPDAQGASLDRSAAMANARFTSFAASRGMLIVVGGPQYRAGSHRQFTLLARDVAATGVPTMRFDYRGMGAPAVPGHRQSAKLSKAPYECGPEALVPHRSGMAVASGAAARRGNLPVRVCRAPLSNS